MENANIISKEKSRELVSEIYVHDKKSVFYYVHNRINNNEDAEDITHDVFVRMLEYGEILCKETVRSFMFTIARNLVTDYLRRTQKKKEIDIYLMYSAPEFADSIESKVISGDLIKLEEMKVLSLPEQRRIIYMKSQYEEKTVDEISKELCLSKRTVEGHLLIGRKQIREFIRRFCG